MASFDAREFLEGLTGESAVVSKTIEQRFLDNPGNIEVEHFVDGSIWKWVGGPVAVVHDSHIQLILELAADYALPWEIKIVAKTDKHYYLKKGSEVPCWMERFMN